MKMFGMLISTLSLLSNNLIISRFSFSTAKKNAVLSNHNLNFIKANNSGIS